MRGDRSKNHLFRVGVFVALTCGVVGLYASGTITGRHGIADAQSEREREFAAATSRRLEAIVVAPPLGAGTGGCNHEDGGKDITGGDFPDDLFCLGDLKRGWLLLHLMCMVYMFCGLAIICDSYFVPSLDKIAHALNLKPDVAGATFMAAGGSAPELATSMLGVFVTQSDLGFGTIVGSAVFNVLFVIAACAFVAPNCPLTWWPLVRDSTCYCVGIIALVAVVIDSEVRWWEAAMLFAFYLGYVTIMWKNDTLEAIIKNRVKRAKEEPRPAYAQLLIKIVEHWLFNALIYIMIVLNVITIFIDNNEMKIINYVCSGFFIAEMVLKWVAYGFFGYWSDGLNVFDGVLVVLIVIELILLDSGVVSTIRVARIVRFLRITRLIRLFRLIGAQTLDAGTQYEEGDWERFNSLRMVSVGMIKAPGPLEIIRSDQEVPSVRCRPELIEEALNQDNHNESENNEEEEEEEDEEPNDPFAGFRADYDGPLWGRLYWICMTPLYLPISITVPDVKNEERCGGKCPRLFPLGFIMSVLWIGALSYIMVWMVTTIGIVIGIPDPVMGVTIVAAGTSIPDMLESLAVAKKGEGDQAVSSSIGSNVFDILVGLPIPWLMFTLINDTVVPIGSDALSIMVLTLFIMVGLVISSIHFSGWMLTKRLGWVMFFLYFVFLAESLVLEYSDITKRDSSA